MKSTSILASPRNRSRIGFALSLLFHALLLLFIVKHQTDPVKLAGNSLTAPLTVQLLPPSTSTTEQTASSAISVPSPQKKQSGHPKEQANKDQNVVRKKAAPAKPNNTVLARAPSTMPAPPPAAPSNAAAPTDMTEMLNAARERRRAAGVPDRNDMPSESKPAQDDNAIARANVEHSLSAQSRGDNDGGGLFQVQWSGVRTAEVIFHGWNANRRNVTRQFFIVDAGLNGDIDTAVIRKMIEIIRQEKSGDFDWESRRLGRVVVLSARPQDDAELMSFLKEDFLAYARRNRPGG
jgi:hypothetical protein